MINFDHNATTPPSPIVRDELCEWLATDELHGNPSSPHGRGRRARGCLELARRRVADALDAHPLEVVFSSGATEANNLGLCGIITHFAAQPGASIPLLAMTRIEHPSVLRVAYWHEARGGVCHWIEADAAGRLPPASDLAAQLRAACGPSQLVLALAAANHELGNAYDVAAYLGQLRSHFDIPHKGRLWAHCDAVQAVGRIPIVFSQELDALTLSGHKLGGVAGAGALLIRRGSGLQARSLGGSQERGMRTGTENMMGIVGLGRAVELAVVNQVSRYAQLDELRQALVAGLTALNIEGLEIHGDPSSHVGNTVLLSVTDCSGEMLAMNLDLAGFAVSTGAACNSGQSRSSAVLEALSHPQAHCALRVSMGLTNSEAEVDQLVAALPAIVERVRSSGVLSPTETRI